MMLYVVGEWHSCRIQLFRLTILIGHSAMWLASIIPEVCGLATKIGYDACYVVGEWHLCHMWAGNLDWV